MKVHNVWFKPTADLLAKDYRALGWAVRVGILPRKAGYFVVAVGP